MPSTRRAHPRDAATRSGGLEMEEDRRVGKGEAIRVEKRHEFHAGAIGIPLDEHRALVVADWRVDIRYSLSFQARPPAGIPATGWAYWMRATDAGADEPIDIIDEDPVDENDENDEGLVTAQEFCKIHTR